MLNNNKGKKRTILVLVLIMAGSILGGCNNSGAQNTEDHLESKVEAAASESDQNVDKEAAGSRIIKDSYDREVEVPEKVERIIPLGNGPRLVTYLGLADKVVGIPACESAKSPIMAYAWRNASLWKELPHVGNDALGAGEWYPEQIVACHPDLIVCTYTKEIADDIQDQTGIPTIAITTPELFSDEYDENLRIIGEACGASERAEALVQYIDTCLMDLENRTKDIPDENKPVILAAGATFCGSHSIDGVYANYPLFQVLNVKDAAAGISGKTGGLLVDREQILAWNPDKIFFDAGSMELIREDYKKDPAYFNQLKAVQNGELYQWPNSTYHYSNVEIPLATAYYVGTMLYPDAFSDVEFNEKASEIFDMFLSEPDFLETLEQYDVSYSQVTLEE